MPVRGNTDWTPQRLAYSAVLMAWGEQPKLVERFVAVSEFLKETRQHWQLGSSYTGWVKGLKREEGRLVPLMVERLRKHMTDFKDLQQCGRWEAYAADGSEFACPRTRVNQQAMGGKGKPDGMPLLSLTSLFHLRLGLPWAFRVGPGTDSERAHLRDMVGELPKDSLLVADAGFIGYDLCRELIDSKQHFLLRVGGNIHLLEELGYAWEQRGQTVYLWPDKQQRKNLPPIELRLIVIRDEHKQPVYLLTSVLDPAALTDEEASELYALRWGIEVQYRTVKQTMEHHVMKSRTPENCYQEMTWTMLGVWLLELMAVRQVVGAGHDPRDISPANARKTVRRVMRNARPCNRTRRTLQQVLARCLKDTYVRQGPKASRNYPRKKHQEPPGPPKFKMPTEKQLQQAKQLIPITLAV